LRAPSPAFVISLIALLVALGGTAYAATSLPRNSVGTKQLKKNAVTAPKIKKGAVTAAKISTSGLTVPSALHATSANPAISATKATQAKNAINATHATSATSATNATNATTAVTAHALTGAQIVAGPSQSLAPNTQADETVLCPAGMVAIGGNQVNDSPDPAVSLNGFSIVNENGLTDNAVLVFLNNGSLGVISWHAYAICIHGSETGSVG